ncbi:hypothetical protein DY000_02016113 [Brassica cretica]|uniref:Uncharacterized protein n=1 Tax=Brassica cretica TaxID=69181 RepID=A0ABQ7DC83_BRACR|nr:hypothetical protein DY000_02016113 [Brassica cretica]
MENIEELENDMWPNLGALFAENLVKLKMKSFQGKGNEEGDAHLTSAHCLKDNRYWSFRDEDGTHLVDLPHRALTHFSGGLTSIQFHPNPLLLRAPSTMPRRYTMQ